MPSALDIFQNMYNFRLVDILLGKVFFCIPNLISKSFLFMCGCTLQVKCYLLWEDGVAEMPLRL